MDTHLPNFSSKLQFCCIELLINQRFLTVDTLYTPDLCFNLATISSAQTSNQLDFFVFRGIAGLPEKIKRERERGARDR